MAVTAAAVLVGPTLAVYTQIYQTGIQDWELYALWAALIVPWAASTRFSAMWLVQLGVVSMATFTLIGETARDSDLWAPLALSAVWSVGRLLPGSTEWCRRTVAAGSALFLTVAGVAAIDVDDGIGWLTLALCGGVFLGSMWGIRAGRVGSWAATCAAAMGVVVAFFVEAEVLHIDGDHPWSWALMGLLVLVQGGAATAWIRRHLEGSP